MSQTDARKLIVTSFPTLKQTQGDAAEVDWDKVVYRCRNPLHQPAAKNQAPGWIFADLVGASRAKGATVQRVHALVLDYDDEARLSEGWLRQRLGRWTYAAHASWSNMLQKGNAPEIRRGRVILPYKRPVTAEEHIRIAKWFASGFAGKLGPEANNPARFYYRPVETPGGYWCWTNTGDWLDVDEAPRPQPRQRSQPNLPRTNTEARVRGLLHQRCDEIRALTDGRRAAVLQAAYYMGGVLEGFGVFSAMEDEVAVAIVDAGVASGTSHAEDLPRTVRDGLNDGRLHPVELEDRPLHDEPQAPDLLAELMAICCPPPHTADKQEHQALLRVFQATHVDDLARMMLTSRDEVATVLNRAQAGAMHGLKGMVGGLQKEVFTAYRKARGAARPHVDPKAPPVLVTPDGRTLFYRRDDGRYGQAPPQLLVNYLQDHQPHLDVMVPKDDGTEAPMKPADAVTAYGRRVDSIVHSLLGECDYQPDDMDGGTLTLPAAVLANIPPRFHQDVDDWLRCLFGADAERGLDWLATVTDLTRPTAALYLEGEPSAGKGMLSAGVAQLWGGDVTSYEKAMGRFNASILSCPVIFLDENIPEGLTSSGAFRTLIGESRHAVEAKGKAVATAKGCVRLIIAANNGDALRIRDSLTRRDMEAIGLRIFHVDVTDEPARFLRLAGGRTFTEEWVTRRDGSPGLLPEHLVWLAQDRDVKPGNRFLVEGNPGKWLQMAGQRVGVVRDVLIAVVRSLGAPANAKRCACPAKKGRVVWVHCEALMRLWKGLMYGKPRPDEGDIQQALAQLSERDTPTQVRHTDDFWSRSGRPRVWPVPLDRVLDVAKTMGIGDPEAIEGLYGPP